MDRALIVVVGVSPAAHLKVRNLMIKMSLQHFAENITDAQIEKGIMEWPEGEGEKYLLPARVYPE